MIVSNSPTLSSKCNGSTCSPAARRGCVSPSLLLLLLPLRLRAIIPKLDIPLGAELPLLQQHTLFPQDILHGDGSIGENLHMIGNQMTVLTSRTRDENGAVVVALLGDTMRAAIGTDLAGEGHFVRGLLFAGL